MVMKSIRGLLRYATTAIDREIYRNKEFVIISNNCWGAESYKRLGVQYNTPFVGLFIFGPDYVKLLDNIDYYLKCILTFKKSSKWIDGSFEYPIGLLDDIEIHFMHYKNDEEVVSKWSRRLLRMKKITDKDKYYIKVCDRDLTDSEVLMKFHNLPFKNKISFGIHSFDNNNHFKIKENDNNKTVPSGIELFRHSFLYLDVLAWITSGKIKKNVYSKIKSIFNIV